MAQLGEADLIVGCNGACRWALAENEDKLETTTDWRPNRFIWYGTSKPFDCLTLTFRKTDVGGFLRPSLQICTRHEHISGGGRGRHMASSRV